MKITVDISKDEITLTHESDEDLSLEIQKLLLWLEKHCPSAFDDAIEKIGYETR